ncbi:signal peptidase I [Patescibacteria group bacterium]|nr:signal peptidase I [Patescibacteria group bacterium]
MYIFAFIYPLSLLLLAILILILLKKVKKNSPIKNLGLDIFKVIGIFVGLLILSNLFVIQPNNIVDDSMSPTLHKGDYFYMIKPLLFQITQHPQRGDIIVYRVNQNQDKVNIGRIIGVDGDKIVIKGGFVHLNGKLLVEPYTLNPEKTIVPKTAVLGKNCQEIDVPDGMYFVLPDNREQGAADSLITGFVDSQDILGIKFLVYYPQIRLSDYHRDTSNDKNLVKKDSCI